MAGVRVEQDSMVRAGPHRPFVVLQARDVQQITCPPLMAIVFLGFIALVAPTWVTRVVDSLAIDVLQEPTVQLAVVTIRYVLLVHFLTRLVGTRDV